MYKNKVYFCHRMFIHIEYTLGTYERKMFALRLNKNWATFFDNINQNKIRIFLSWIFSHNLKISQNTGPGKDEKKFNKFIRQ